VKIRGIEMALIIGGHPRSGTTLLLELCNGHPDITITNEFGNFRYLGRAYKEYRHMLLKRLWDKRILENRNLLWSRDNKLSLKVVKILSSHAFLARYFFEIRKYRRNIIDASIIEVVLQHIFSEARIVGDKEPHYVFALDELAGAEGLSCLIIYRDCRDVVSSVLEKAHTIWRNKAWAKDFDSSAKIANKWIKAIELMERNSSKIYTLRYENLVLQPVVEIEALSKWLGVDPAGFSVDIISVSSIGKYKSRLNDKDLKTIMEIAGTTMLRYGYI
jgi:hypothetical protein